MFTLTLVLRLRMLDRTSADCLRRRVQPLTTTTPTSTTTTAKTTSLNATATGQRHNGEGRSLETTWKRWCRRPDCIRFQTWLQPTDTGGLPLRASRCLWSLAPWVAMLREVTVKLSVVFLSSMCTVLWTTLPYSINRVVITFSFALTGLWISRKAGTN